MEAKTIKLEDKCWTETFLNVENNEININNVTSHLAESDDFNELVFMQNDEESLLEEAVVVNEGEEKICLWVDSAIKYLLARIKYLRPRIGKSVNLRTKKQMWKKISEELCEKGYWFNATQVEAKYFALKRQYRRVTLINKKTGRGRQTCPYQKEIISILNENEEVKPEYLLDSETEVSPDETTVQNLTLDSDQSKRESASSTSKKRKSAFDQYLENAIKHAEMRYKNDEKIRKMLENNFRKKEERAERREAIENKKLELLERLIKHLEN